MKFRSLLTAICVLAAAQMASAAPYAYIANSGNKTVSVIDTATNGITATVTLPDDNGATLPDPYAYSITVGASGQYVYVGLRDTNEVAIIDAATNAVVKRITLGNDEPGGLAVNAAETRLYVAHSMSNVLRVIDITGAGASEVGRVTVHDSTISNPEGVVLNSAGTKAYVANASTDSIAEITLDEVNNIYTRSLISLPVGSKPFGLAISSDGTKLYYSSYDGNGGVVNTSTYAITPLTTDPGNITVAVSPNNSKVYAPSNATGDIFVIDGAAVPNVVLGSYPSGVAPFGSSITPDGEKLFLTMDPSGTGDSVKVFSTASNTVTATIPLTGANPKGLGNFIGPVWDHTIKSTSTSGCTITPGELSPGLNVPVNSYGWNFTIAAGCYVTVNGTPVGMVTSYKMTNVTDDFQTITASQVPSFSVTADWISTVNGFLISTNSNNPQGQNIDESTKGQPVFFPQGTTVYIKAGGTGFSASNWTGDCAGTTGSICTLPNLSANKTVGATVITALPGGLIRNETSAAFYADWASCKSSAANSDYIKVSTDPAVKNIDTTASGKAGYMYYMSNQWKPDFSGLDSYTSSTLTIVDIGVTVSTTTGETLTL